MDEGKTAMEDKDIAKTLNQYFTTAVNYRDIIENKSLLTETKNLEDPSEIAIKKFEIHHHPNLCLIKETFNINDFFQFSEITTKEILSEINNPTIKSRLIQKIFQLKSLKEFPEINCEYLTKIFF